MRKPRLLVKAARRSAGRSVIGALALGVVGLVATACNPVTPYAAIVDGTVITQSSVQAEMHGINANPTYRQSVSGQIPITGTGPDTYTSQFAAAVLTLQVRFAVLDHELAQRHLVISAQDLADAKVDLVSSGQYPGGEFTQFPADYQAVLVRRQAELSKLAAGLAHADTSPAGVAAYAAAHEGELSTACVSWIVLNTPADAAQVEADLAGGQAFSAEAAAKSVDTSTGSSGGQLGCHPTPQYSQLGSEFEQAVASAPLNQPSAPVPVSSASSNGGPPSTGTAVFEVTSRQPLSAADLAAYARSQMTQPGQAALGPLVEQAVRAADVVVDARYGTWDPNGPSGSAVTPPAAPNVHSDSKP